MNSKLKLKILESGRPQIGLAKDLGISEAWLSRIVKGWVNPDNQLKEKIAEVLECRVDEVFPETGNEAA
jgi:DNA-binding XRE family transcriptional regulator